MRAVCRSLCCVMEAETAGMTEAVLHHGDDDAVGHLCGADHRRDAGAVQGPENVQVEAHGGHQKLVAAEIPHVESLPAAQVIFRRQDGQQRVLRQREPVHGHPVLEAGKAHVRLVLPDPAVHLLHAAHLDIHRQLRVDPAELLDHLRQPVHGDAGIGGHPDGVLLVGIDQGNLPVQGLGSGQHLANQGIDALPRRSQPHTGPAPQQHRKADVPLQTVHHVGHAGLGIAQGLRRPGQALVGVEADGAVAHGGEHHRHGQLQLGRQIRDQVPLGVPPDPLRLFA